MTRSGPAEPNGRLAVAYVCSSPTYALNVPSGYATHIRELADAMREAGLGVEVLLPFMMSKVRSAATSAPRLHPLRKFLPTWSWAALKDLNRGRKNRQFGRWVSDKLDRSRPDVIYERIDFTGSILLEWCQANNIPHVLEIHDPLSEPSHLVGERHPLLRRFRRRVLDSVRHADRIVVVSDILKEWLISAGVDSRRISVVSNGVNTKMFDLATIDQTAVKNVRAGSSNPIVGYVGSALGCHGLPALLEAFAETIREVPAQLLLVGLSSESRELSDLVNALKLGNHVRFLKAVPYEQVPNVIASIDVAVLAGANAYQNPIKLFEYGALGRPMVAPRTHPILEILKDREDALLVESENKEQITSALCELLKDRGLREKIGRQVMRKIRSEYSWSQSGAKVVALFRSLVLEGQ